MMGCVFVLFFLKKLGVVVRQANKEGSMSQSVLLAVQVQRHWTGPSECHVMYAKTAYPDRELRSS
jgi:hypothetical protein